MAFIFTDYYLVGFMISYQMHSDPPESSAQKMASPKWAARLGSYFWPLFLCLQHLCCLNRSVSGKA